MTIPKKPATYGDINKRTAEYAAREMLRHNEPILILERIAYGKLPWWKKLYLRLRRPGR